MSLATSVATGQDFIKWEVTTPVGVLYVDGEMPINEIKNRLAGFLDRETVKPLEILSHEFFFENCERDLNITDDDIQDAISNYLDEHDIGLLIIDNLSCLSRIREDKSDDWRERVQPFLTRCRRRRVAVVLVHHTGKGGDQRGTGAREDQLDTSIKLGRTDGNNHEGASFKVEFTKSRGCFDASVEPFEAFLTNNSQGGLMWEISSIEASTVKRLATLVKDMGSEGINVTDAAADLGVSKSMITKSKKQLLEEGKLQEEKQGRKVFMVSKE